MTEPLAGRLDGPWQESFEGRRRWFEEFPLHRQLGLKLLETSPGYAKCVMETSAFTLGGVGGSVHGGILACLVDIVMLAALSGQFKAGEQPAGTADLNITYLRPALGAKIFAEGKVLKKGRQIAVVEVEISDAEGRLCAKGRTL
ncbi:MAG: PaaI family thioesterase, partial [Dehalococcoidia bacterium]